MCVCVIGFFVFFKKNNTTSMLQWVVNPHLTDHTVQSNTRCVLHFVYYMGLVNGW
jgi:hypothetical protein